MPQVTATLTCSDGASALETLVVALAACYCLQGLVGVQRDSRIALQGATCFGSWDKKTHSSELLIWGGGGDDKESTYCRIATSFPDRIILNIYPFYRVCQVSELCPKPLVY